MPEENTTARQTMTEVSDAINSVKSDTVDRVASIIAGAHTVVAYGCGREGLAIKGLVMRLFHAGINAHVVADMTCPPVKSNDLLIVSCGPGRLSTVTAIMDRARAAGARILYFTAEPDIPPAEVADEVVSIKAQTMAQDHDNQASVLPMGSSFEIALFILGDLITNRVRAIRGESAELMRSRHTNLE